MILNGQKAREYEPKDKGFYEFCEGCVKSKDIGVFEQQV